MNPKHEITDLTICRAAFAAWVFAYHVNLYVNIAAHFGWLGHLIASVISHGYLGVDGFFILSGFILARAYPTPPQTRAEILNFWGRRLARLYPVHLAVIMGFIGLLAAFTLTGHSPRLPARFGADGLLANLTLTQGWGFAPQGSWNYPAWSISTEWAGYLAFPWVWRVLRYFDIYVAIQLVVALVLIIGFMAYMHHGSLNLAFTAGLLRFVPEFILGLATSRLIPVMPLAINPRVLCACGLAVTVFFLCVAADAGMVIGLWLVLAALTLDAQTAPTPMFGHRPWLTGFGHFSYSFYMSFAVAETIICQVFEQLHAAPAAHPALFATAMLASTLGFGGLLYATIERPARHYLDARLAALPLPAKPL
ncbi:MAG: acyltransferase [Acidocella sp.]|nr:acyltransferase [Acidocella sp.]